MNMSGIGPDENPGTDQFEICRNRKGEAATCLTFRNLRDALTPDLPNIEVIYLAGCSAATAEVFYELRDVTDYVVASQQYAYEETPHTNYIIDFPYIQASTTAKELAEGMAYNYYQHWDFTVDDTLRPLTISVANLEHINEMKFATDALAASFNGKMQIWLSTIQSIWELTQRFSEDDGYNIDQEDELLDLYHFAYLVTVHIDDPEIRAAAVELMNVIRMLVPTNSEYHQSGKYGDYQWNLHNSNGVSIFSPFSPFSFYTADWLDFAEGADWTFALASGEAADEITNWGSFVSTYVMETNPTAPDDPNPPPLLPPIRTEFFTYLPVITR